VNLVSDPDRNLVMGVEFLIRFLSG